jgi:hypothetical protein
MEGLKTDFSRLSLFHSKQYSEKLRQGESEKIYLFTFAFHYKATEE